MPQKTNFDSLAEKLYASQGLPKNIDTEAQLWDEILKKEVFLMPKQIFPLIQEIWGISYESNIPVKPLATEYPIDRIKNQKISSIHSDITIQIGSENIFHFECESKRNRNVTVRIFEYDSRIALSYNVASHSIEFPYSALIYIAHQYCPSKILSLNLRFKKNGNFLYQVPILNVQAYSLAEIKEKHLYILIPFLPIRFRKFLSSSKNRHKISKKELTSFYRNIILILDEEVKNNYLNEYDRTVILKLLRKAFIRVFYQHIEYLKEVLAMTEPILELENEEYFYIIKKKDDELAKKEFMLAEKDKEISLLKEKITELQAGS